MAREVDRPQIADRRLAGAGDLENLGAQVRQMHGPSGLRRLVARAIGLVLEGHPAVSGLGERAHHPGIQIPRAQTLLCKPTRLGLDVGGFERCREQIRQLRDILGIEQGPRPVLLDPAHEQVGDPVGEIQVVGPPALIARVVTQLEKGFDVGMPGLEIHTGRALAFAALVDGRYGGVEGLQPGDDAVGESVGGPDQRALRADPVPGDSNAAGEFRQEGDVLVTVVNRFQRIRRRVQEKTARELLVPRSGIEQRGRACDVVEAREQVIQLDSLADVGTEGDRDSHPEVLRRLEHMPAGRVLQQIPVVEGPQSEVFELLGPRGIDRIVELAGMGLDEPEYALVDEPDVEP